jgi:hypothetical protein
MSYNVGDIIQTTAIFTVKDAVTNEDVLTDPDTVIVRVRPRSATTYTVYTYGTDAEVVKVGVGVYRADILATSADVWLIRIEGTNAAQGAETSSYVVEP